MRKAPVPRFKWRPKQFYVNIIFIYGLYSGEKFRWTERSIWDHQSIKFNPNHMPLTPLAVAHKFNGFILKKNLMLRSTDEKVVRTEVTVRTSTRSRIFFYIYIVGTGIPTHTHTSPSSWALHPWIVYVSRIFMDLNSVLFWSIYTPQYSQLDIINPAM